MPKGKEKTIRNIELHPDVKKEIDRLIAAAEKKGTGNKNEFMELFYEQFEADDNQGKELRNLGIENKAAQKYAAMFANSIMGKKSVQPVYDVYINVNSIRHGEYVDDRDKKKKPIITANGGLILVNPKTKNKTDEKLGEVVAYADDTEKIDILEEGKVFKIQAATSNIKPNFLHLKIDDRCGNAEKANEKMTEIMKLQTELYDITKIKDKMDEHSNGKYDYRLVEGMIESIMFPRNQNFARVSLSDLSLTQEDYEEKKYDAYLTMLCNKEVIMKTGKGSIIRVLGELRYDNNEDYGEQVTLMYPPMITPLMLVEPEVYESTTQTSDDDEDVADASDYFVKEKEEEEDTESESEVEELEEKEEEFEENDPYESVKNHDCWISGDFGKPEDDEPGCKECKKEEPDVYKLCKQRKKELEN